MSAEVYPPLPGAYVCAHCGGGFPWHDEAKAVAELAKRSPGVKPADCVMVCDECFDLLMRYQRAAPTLL